MGFQFHETVIRFGQVVESSRMFVHVVMDLGRFLAKKNTSLPTLNRSGFSVEVKVRLLENSIA